MYKLRQAWQAGVWRLSRALLYRSSAADPEDDDEDNEDELTRIQEQEIEEGDYCLELEIEDGER